jgi:hypothetical protein
MQPVPKTAMDHQNNGVKTAKKKPDKIMGNGTYSATKQPK